MKIELDTIHEQQSNYGNSVANLIFTGGTPTFAEFCDFIAENSKDEWGEICVVKNCRLILQDKLDRVKYSYGNLKGKPKEEYANSRLKQGTCWYSWNNYDYYVVLECEEPQKPLTNYDQLIHKTPEELARIVCKGCPPVDGCFRVNEYETPNCVECWLDWLKQEGSE